MSEKINVAQFGTKHGHAKGVLEVMLAHPEVRVIGVWEPDSYQQKKLEKSNDLIWKQISWIEDPNIILDDKSILAVTSEGGNFESLSHTEKLISANKHVFYDKPAGENYIQFKKILALAQKNSLHLQMGYMFRKHQGFMMISDWVKSGLLGKIFQIRAHMSTWIPENKPDNVNSRKGISVHKGGILYDLAGHMLDQIVWILGRPNKITNFLQNTYSETKNFMDNTIAICEYDKALAIIDISAIEIQPTARRFEVYGTEGSAIMEPFEPAKNIHLCLNETKNGFKKGVTIIPIKDTPRYVDTFAEFIRNIKGESKPLRSYEHELLVQETLLRATGKISE